MVSVGKYTIHGAFGILNQIQNLIGHAVILRYAPCFLSEYCGANMFFCFLSTGRTDRSGISGTKKADSLFQPWEAAKSCSLLPELEAPPGVCVCVLICTTRGSKYETMKGRMMRNWCWWSVSMLSWLQTWLIPDICVVFCRHHSLIWPGWKLGGVSYLEDHPRTCKWLITMVIGFVPDSWGCGTPYKWIQMAFPWLIHGGDPNHLQVLGDPPSTVSF